MVEEERIDEKKLIEENKGPEIEVLTANLLVVRFPDGKNLYHKRMVWAKENRLLKLIEEGIGGISDAKDIHAFIREKQRQILHLIFDREKRPLDKKWLAANVGDALFLDIIDAVLKLNRMEWIKEKILPFFAEILPAFVKVNLVEQEKKK